MLDRSDQIPVLAGFFKRQFFYCGVHLRLELADQILDVPAQKAGDFLGDFLVDFRIDVQLAGSQALSDVIVQAQLLRHFITLAQRIELVEQLHRLMRRRSVRERTVVFRLAVFLGVAHNPQRRISFMGQLDIGIRGIVHEHDVVARTIFLDQIDFQHQRFLLAGGDDVVEVNDVADKLGRLVIVRAYKILVDAVFQFFGLADIDDRVIFVLHQIAAGL